MRHTRLIAGFAVLLVSLNAQGQAPQRSIKGYELYSWKSKGHWYYSLLPRTNHLKSYEEIMAASAVRRDAEGLKAELQRLPRGEDLFWMSDAPSSFARTATARKLNLKHPSLKRIKSIKAICDKLGIKLRLT